MNEGHPNPDWDGVMKARAREPKPARTYTTVDDWRRAEAGLSDAYLRLRRILGAFDTPPTPHPALIWQHTEQRARAIVEALRGLVEIGQCCEAASVGKPHDRDVCRASVALEPCERWS